MKITKKHLLNGGFIIVLALLIYPPTKVYFIRLVSFAPTEIPHHKQNLITSYNWKLDGLNTKSLNFNALEGKVVFINFWATWCPPCIAEMPSMKLLYERYKDQVVFLFVTNEDWHTVNTFYTKHSFNFPTYNQGAKAPLAFQTSSIPRTLVIGKDKRIVIDKKGVANWNSTSVRALLDTLLN